MKDKTYIYIAPACDDVLLSSEGPIMAGSTVGVSIDSFESDQNDYSGGWGVIN